MPKSSTGLVPLFAGRVLLSAALTACGDQPTARAPVASVVISPASPIVLVMDSVRLTATALDARGNALAGRAAQWSSNDDTKATVSSTGAVTSKALGSVEITATMEDRVATTTLTIVPVPVAARVSEFFTAFSWPGNAYTSPVLTQPYDVSQCHRNPGTPCLNENVYRQQWNNLWDWPPVVDWAARHPGHVYTLGDDVNDHGFEQLYTDNPKLYASDYCRFVRNVQAVDPTAEFGTSMIQEPAQEWWLNDYADAVLAIYNAGDCGINPISEWTFNVYPRWSRGLAGFTDYIGRHASWAVSRPAPIGAPLVVGAWVLGWVGDDVPNDDPAYLARLREAKAWLFANPNIKAARYLLFEPWHPENSDPHPLADAAGNLNASGRVYAEVTGRIKGPTAVRPGVSCIWSAETTGGPPPYAYEWLVDGLPVARRDGIAYANSGSGFVLQMRVTDGHGGHSIATLNVSVTSSAPSCLP